MLLLPFPAPRSVPRPTDGNCHVLQIIFWHGSDPYKESAASQEGYYGCRLLGPTVEDWQYVRSEVNRDKRYWTHYCRRCGLQNYVLSW